MRLIGTDWSQRQFITENSNVSVSEGWMNANARNTGKIYIIKGHQYVTVAKKERHLPFFTLQRIAGIVLGLFLSIISFGTAPLLSKTVRQMFSGRQILRIMRRHEKENAQIANNNEKIVKKPDLLPLPSFPRQKTPEEIREMAKNDEPYIAYLRDMHLSNVEAKRKNQVEHLNNITALERKQSEVDELVAVAGSHSVDEQESVRKAFTLKKAARESLYQEELAKIEKTYSEGIAAAHEWYRQKLDEVTARTNNLISKKEENRQRLNELSVKLNSFKFTS